MQHYNIMFLVEHGGTHILGRNFLKEFHVNEIKVCNLSATDALSNLIHDN